MQRLVDLALDFLFPPVCGVCGKFNSKYICPSCIVKIKRLESFHHIKTEEKYYSEQAWLFEYKDEIRSLILNYKFNEKSYLYKMFAEIIMQCPEAVKYIKSADYIVPVPIHKTRMKERGYNQCGILAKELSNQIQNIEFLPKLLYKYKKTSPQSTLSKEERADNVKHVFSIKNMSTDYLGKSVVLIDDIYTTGNTVKECSKQLKSAGFEDIKVFTIARD